ncbi:hypothetical protein [Metapseudomonas otitidis]|uniref:hypothetical protein n=1 Tax=Metapseudomonas otitidis TaxID=319939 RepID=UPI0016018380|nr:hypothetical protein [Pseudomonas otitidis]
MDKTEVLFRIIERYDHYIENANNKANYALTFAISLSVAIAALLGYSEIFKFEINKGYLNIMKILTILTYIANSIFALIIFLGIHKIIFPNTSAPEGIKKSNIFFGDVASLGHDNYAASVEDMTTESLQLDLSIQVRIMAGIIDEKFKIQKTVMNIISRQYIVTALITSILCGIIKSIS